MIVSREYKVGGRNVRILASWGRDGVYSVRGVGRWTGRMKKGTLYRNDTETVNNKTMLIIRKQLDRVFKKRLLGVY